MSSGVLGLVIFFGCVILYIVDVFPMAVVSIVGCVMMVAFGLCSFSDAFGQFGSSAVFLTIGSMIIGGTIIESGLQKLLSSSIQRFTARGELLVLTVVYWITAVASAFMNNMTVMAMMIPIVYAVCSENNRIDPRNIFMPMVSAAVMGGLCTLVGSTQQLAAQGVLEQYGAQTFKVFDFTPMGAIILAVGYIYCIFIGYPMGKRLWGNREAVSALKTDHEISEQGAAASKGKIKALVVILAVMVLLYITEWIPAAATAMLCASLCILLGLIRQEHAFSAIDWNVIGRIGGSFGLAKGLEVSGGLDILTDLFMSVFGVGLSPYMLFVAVCVIAMLLSEVMSNSVAILTVLPIILAVAPDFGLNVTAYAFGIVFAASFGMACPLSCSAKVLVMQTGYTFRDFFRYGTLLDVMDLVLTIIIVPVLMPLTL